MIDTLRRTIDSANACHSLEDRTTARHTRPEILPPSRRRWPHLRRHGESGGSTSTCYVHLQPTQLSQRDRATLPVSCRTAHEKAWAIESSLMYIIISQLKVLLLNNLLFYCLYLYCLYFVYPNFMLSCVFLLTSRMIYMMMMMIRNRPTMQHRRRSLGVIHHIKQRKRKPAVK